MGKFKNWLLRREAKEPDVADRARAWGEVDAEITPDEVRKRAQAAVDAATHSPEDYNKEIGKDWQDRVGRYRRAIRKRPKV